MVSLLFLIPIGVLAASTAAIFIKLCDAPALIIATYRMVFASLILLPYALYKKTGRTWGRKEIGWLILSGFFLSLHFTFWIGSLKYTSVASSVVLVTTYPIFVGIGSRLFLKERMGLYLNLWNHTLRFGQRTDQLWRYGHLKRGIDGRWAGPLGGHHSLRILSGGKKDEKESGPPLLYLPGLFHSRIPFGHLFSPFSKKLLWIFMDHLSLPLSSGPHSPIDRPHHHQLGFEISPGFNGGDYLFG